MSSTTRSGSDFAASCSHSGTTLTHALGGRSFVTVSGTTPQPTRVSSDQSTGLLARDVYRRSVNALESPSHNARGRRCVESKRVGGGTPMWGTGSAAATSALLLCLVRYCVQLGASAVV